MRAVALLVMLALLELVAGPPQSAWAAESSNLTPLLFPDKDIIYNYDFTTTTGAGYQTVDWGTSLLFYNNASVNKVKGDGAVARYFAFGGPQYGWVDDGTTTGPSGTQTPRGFYDSDRGIKTDTPSCFGDTRHFRIYADGDDRLYDMGLGYWVYATTHKDFNELCADYYGDSEGTENDVAARFRNNGHAVFEDYASFFNYEPKHVDRLNSKHRWDSNGKATYVNIP